MDFLTGRRMARIMHRFGKLGRWRYLRGDRGPRGADVRGRLGDPVEETSMMVGTGQQDV